MKSFQPRSEVLVAAAWVLTCAASILAGTALTLAPAEQARAWPLPGAAPGTAAATGPAAAFAAALAVLALFAAAGHARARGWERPFAELILVYPLLLAAVWFVLGAGPPGPAAWLTGGVLAAALAALARAAPRSRPPGPPPARRRWLAADLVMVAGPAAVGLATGVRPDWPGVLQSAVTYPLYAWLQLAVFLVLPARRLRAMGLGPAGTAVACGLVFALLHWPQPLVVALTFAGMAVWTSAWVRGRPLWELALVMGLAATAATQLMPAAWTDHMSVGPRAVRALAVRDLAGGPGPGPVPGTAWLASVYPVTVGRRLAPGEADRWRQALDAEHRVLIAWEMVLSDEYARRAATGACPPAPPLAETWRDLPSPWPDRLAALADPARFPAAGGPREAYVAALYRELLGRDPEPGAVARWSWSLFPLQRARLARLLLSERAELRNAPFRSSSFPRLRLPRG